MWRVVVGANRLSQLGPEVEVRNIKRLLMHEYYRGIKSGHDIALLELDQPVQCSQYIQLACVPDASLKVMDLSDCYVSGWGSTEQRCEFPKTVVQSESLACWGDGLGFPDGRGTIQGKAMGKYAYREMGLTHFPKQDRRDTSAQCLSRHKAKT